MKNRMLDSTLDSCPPHALWRFLLGLLFVAFVAPARTSDSVDAVSVFEEPSHRIILTNDRLSVYRVDIQAVKDTQTRYHYHVNDQLTVITIDSSGFDLRLGGEARQFSAPAGTMLFTSYSAERVSPHQIRVPAGEQFGVVGIEFFGPPSSRLEQRFSEPAEPDFEIPQAQVRRLVLEGDERLSPGTLLVSLGDYTLTVGRPGALTSWNAARGDVYWVDIGARDVKVSSTQPSRLILVTLKPH